MKRMLGIAASCSISLTHSQLGSVDTEGKMLLFPTLVGVCGTNISSAL